MSKGKSIAIVGVGVKGTYALVRFLENASLPDYSSQQYHLHLVEPADLGSGITYSVDSKDYLLMNTVASQITAYADETCSIKGKKTTGPSLKDWADIQGKLIGANEYPKRRDHGEYLCWVVKEAMRKAPPNITFTIHKEAALDLKLGRTSHQLILESKKIIKVHSVLLSFGGVGYKTNCINVDSQEVSYGSLKIEGRRFFTAYPLEKWIQSISNKDSVGILGMGLGMIDAVISLTVGKGGSFVECNDSGEYRYISSGKEPKIYCWCRSGLPAHARANNQKPLNFTVQPKKLNHKLIERVRQESGFDGIDFKEKILPVLCQEMEQVFKSSKKLGKHSSKRFKTFDWEDWIQPKILRKDAFRDYVHYREELIELLEDDLHEACLGNINGPFKAACDFLRDARDLIREAVEFAGLTPNSHRWFVDIFTSAHNRLVVGPPLSRSKELLALYKSGVIDLGLGPNPKLFRDQSKGFSVITSHFNKEKEVSIDVLIDGRVTRKPSQLLQNLIKNGVLSLAELGNGKGDYSINAVQCDNRGRVLSSNGKIQPGVHIVGQPAEGYLWYTFVASRPMVDSRAIRDADDWSLQALSDSF